MTEDTDRVKHGHSSVWWSDEDDVWLATEIGRPGGTVHGATPDAALREAMDVAEEWEAAGYPITSTNDWDAGAVRDLRRSLAMTQREFAALLNISLSTARSWEQGQRIPSGPTTRLLDFVKAAPGLARQMHQTSDPVVEVG